MTTMARQVFGTADNTDVLAGTDLAEVPFAGMMIIYGAATQNDHTLTVTAPSIGGSMGVGAPLRAGPLKLRANAEIRSDEDPPMATFPISEGQSATLNLDVVTAGTFSVLVILTDGQG